MKKLKEFDIEIIHLKENTSYTYDFDLDESFFNLFEDSLIQKGSVHVDVELYKTPVMIRMNFRINGTIELICDRSLDTFDYPIQSEELLQFSFSEQEGEISIDTIGIRREAIKINIAQYLYEFIGIEVPLKKLHPRFAQEEDASEEAETTLIYSTETKEEKSNEDPSEDQIDPRWLALNSLKDKSKLN